ncbi:cytosine-purine permease [Phyllosticta citriasiana]|uniref:Cytosine-purine permease n=1 Tax=Phyllosticta citriasiana TaxID=595635 RepID=A0ABR1KC25_9PEZI
MGLSWKLVLVTIALGQAIMTIALTFNGVIGARFHIPYTIQSPASFEIYLSSAMVVVRMIVAAFWYGINTYTGAECVDTIIRAIWPRFANIPNHLPESANITTEMMISYLIYFVVILPFHCIHPRNLRWFFALKSLLPLPAILGMVIWACTNTGGGTDNPVFNRGNTSKGAALGWIFMSGMNAMMGNYGTLAVNINDFTRYAKKPQMTYVQLFIIPTVFVFMAAMGMIIVGSANALYGELQWDPLKIMNNWNGSSQARAGANIGANCISAANDLNAIFPKYINLRRGQYVIAFIGAWALTPWNILSSAEALLNFMDGYTIWLAPITGVLLIDFWLIHDRQFEVYELYMPTGRYNYNRWGTNWRAAVACSTNISSGAKHMYSLGYLYGILTSFFVYVVLSRVWKP